MSKEPAITTRPLPRNMLASHQDYMVMLHGVSAGKLYYNMRGYCFEKGIPLPNGRRLDPGEISLTQCKAEIARANKEWKAHSSPLGSVTGRLSSRGPAMQSNAPKTDEFSKIRQAFVGDDTNGG